MYIFPFIHSTRASGDAPMNGVSLSTKKPHGLMIKFECPAILDLYVSTASCSCAHPYDVALDLKPYDSG